MTEPFVTAWVRSSVFAAGALARETKTAPPPSNPTRATAKTRPGHVIRIPLSTLIDHSPSLIRASWRGLQMRRVCQPRRDHRTERVGEGAQDRESAQIWDLPCDIDKGGA